MPVRHSDRKTGQIAAVRWQCGKHARTPCKIQTRPASSQRYDQSAAIWHQTKTAVRDKPSKRYDANWGQSTMGIKSVTARYAPKLLHGYDSRRSSALSIPTRTGLRCTQNSTSSRKILSPRSPRLMTDVIAPGYSMRSLRGVPAYKTMLKPL